MRRVCLLLCAAITLFLARPADAGLKEYVAKDDPTYQFEVVKSVPAGTSTVDLIKLTSQTWEGITWWHWLSIIRPAEVTHPEMALLLIAGGGNDSREPNLNGQEARVLVNIAERTGSITAVLSQTPNQPLFDGRHEDEIIAYTYDKFLKGEGEDWPLLLPMVKGAVRAMDTIQAVGKEKYTQDIQGFVLTGASKRGWTTWLSAAADRRVKAIVPIVIDMLDLGKQAAHQLASYGTYSDQVEDYTTLHIQERLDSPEGAKLLSMVDPFSYRDELTLPKLVILGSNDPYWCVDSANLYFPGLKGEKRLYYEANTGHDVSPGGIASIAEFYNCQLIGHPYPALTTEDQDGALTVTWEKEGGKALLWQATSPARDFRNAPWTSSPLDGDKKVVAKVEAPASGWLASYVEVQFPSVIGLPCGVTTQMHVTPDTFPFEKKMEAAAATGAAAGR